MYTPSRRDFREYARSGRRVPVAACVPLETTVDELFESVRFSSPHILLESCRIHPVTGRYSILVGEPKMVRTFQGRALNFVQQILQANSAVAIKGFPPFVGGAVGFVGYDAYQRRTDDIRLPDVGFLFCDEALVADHLEKKLWIIACSETASDVDRAYDEAVGRVEALLKRVLRAAQPFMLREPQHERQPFALSLAPPERRTDPPILVAEKGGIQSTHTQTDFENMVRQAKEFIARGNIYQVNLSQRFTVPSPGSSWDLYCRLKKINPSPFAVYADFSPLERDGSANIFGGRFQVVSASPERLFRTQGGTVETRPIAGTRRRGETAAETVSLRKELLLNAKERAEHLMLVDLERNDLGRICRYGSVQVDRLMELEEYSHVIHIVSNIRGQLRPEPSLSDIFSALFPGGTITGCPKIRSMEIIEALEPVRRHLYTGSMGYISYSGRMDFNILIRTAFVVDDCVYVQTGAGIVADSDPGREYDETVQKARALLEALHIQQPIGEPLVAAS